MLTIFFVTLQPEMWRATEREHVAACMFVRMRQSDVCVL